MGKEIETPSDKPTDHSILLILDLDETLIYATESPVERTPDFRVGPYFVYQRPQLQEFLLSCAEAFHLAIWSSSGADYLDGVLAQTFPAEISLTFVWSRDRCVQRFDPEWQERYFVKDLKKVKRLGFDLDRVLVVDDTPKKLERNYGNAIYVEPYFGDPDDDELPKLARYLGTMASAKNLRRIEKRNWKNQISVEPQQ